MDAMHEKGVRAFPAKTEGKGNQLLELRMERGVKVYDLTAEELQWEVEPGRKVKAWAYNGQVPGPQIRVRQGDRVHAATQVGLGLLGAFIVEPRRPRPAHKADVDHVMVLNDGSPNPGTWAFHCHILPHAESEHGMFGMVTALVVQPAAA
jgi:FtsP/CotA-like multicopper oxidase with cupredoxin domain